jgi:F-type H+-transporting ATPase subunit delta
MSTPVTDSTHHAYALSLVELADARQQLPAVAEEVSQLRELLEQNPTLPMLLADPAAKSADRAALLERAFSGKLSPLTYNFLRLLHTRGKLRQLPAVLDAFEAIMDERLGKIEVDVFTAHKLDDGELADVKNKVSQKLGRDAVVHPYVDETLIGGMVLRIGDKLIDGSVRAQLDAMRKKLLSAAPR